MKKTGIFLTKKETEEMKKLAEDARNTPMFGITTAQCLSGNDFSALAHKRMFARLTELAKSHGLPDIAGEYGLTNKGEIITI